MRRAEQVPERGIEGEGAEPFQASALFFNDFPAKFPVVNQLGGQLGNLGEILPLH